MKKIFLALAAALLLGLAPALALAQTATLLPNGRQQFLDANGDPLAGGEVFMYVPPATTTPKTTWQDASRSVPNANPIVLDSAGTALIYGSGGYRQLVKDVLGNTIWDAQTASGGGSGGVLFAGISTGSANAQVINATLFSNSDGEQVAFMPGFTNTGAMTLDAGFGPASVLLPIYEGSGVSDAVPLQGEEVTEGNYTIVAWVAAQNAWQIVRGTDNVTAMPFVVHGDSVAEAAGEFETVDSAGLDGPVLLLDRISSSPAAADGLGSVLFRGRGGAAQEIDYGIIRSEITDPATATGEMEFYTSIGAPVKMLALGQFASGVPFSGVVALPRGLLSFPATAATTADPNTLSDYEYGTYNPTLTAGASVFNVTSTSGYFYKIGTMVWFWGRVAIANSGNSLTADPLTMSLPKSILVATSASMLCDVEWTASTASYVSVSAKVESFAGGVRFYGLTAAATSNGTNAAAANQLMHATNSSTISVACMYQSLG